MRNLCREVIEHERIKTSEAKAKAVKPKLEKLITLGKRGDLHARRQALSELSQDKFLVHKLFEEIAPRYAERPGGYARIVKLGPRRSDSTEMVFLELGLGSRAVPTARLDIAYDGSRFSGWAAQPGQRTVQAEVESGVERILGEWIELTVAGRTDSGVHATGQVASFEHGASCPDSSRSASTPSCLTTSRCWRPGRRPTASTRAFRRRRASIATALLLSTVRDPFEERRALWWRYPLDRELLDAAAAAVVGKHDFTAFTPDADRARAVRAQCRRLRVAGTSAATF